MSIYYVYFPLLKTKQTRAGAHTERDLREDSRETGSGERRP